MDIRQLTSDLVEEVFGMWRYRWIALAATWVLAAIGWVAVLLLPNQYDASARVFVDTETMLKPLLRELTVNSDTLSDVALVTEALLSQPQLKLVAAESGLAAGAVTPEEKEQLLITLRQKVSIAKMPRQDIFVISYRDHDPVMAQAVVQVLLKSFVGNSLDKDRTNFSQAQQFLTQQIKMNEKRLEEAESLLAAFKKKNVGLMPGEGGDYFARLSTADAELKRTQLDVRSLEERRAELLRQVNNQDPVIGVPRTSVEGTITTLEAQLAELRIKLMDKHPDVVRVKETLADLYKIRDQELLRVGTAPSSTTRMDPVYQQMRASLSATEVELASLRSQLTQRQATVASLRRSVDTIPEVEAQLNRLNRDYDIVKAQYDALVERLESARLSESVQADEEKATFEVIEPPRVPLFPTSPNRLLLYSAVLAAALLAGLGVAFLLNQHNRVFYSGRRLRAATGLPIFGSVSMTRAEPINRRNLAFAWIASGLLVSFLVLLVVGMAGIAPA